MINHIENFFKRKYVLLPVIHSLNKDQIFKQTELCAKYNCNGIFLIDQGMDTEEMLKIIPSLRNEFNPYFLGANMLAYNNDLAVKKAIEYSLDGIWLDDCGIDCYNLDWSEWKMSSFNDYRKDYKGLIFGGVAFKYQQVVPPELYGTVASIACCGVDIVTTSGQGTGEAPSKFKIEKMRSNIDNFALAIASGISAENIDEFNSANAFIVASSIEKEFGYFDEGKLKLLSNKIHIMNNLCEENELNFSTKIVEPIGIFNDRI